MQNDDIETRLNTTWILCYTVANYPETLEKVLIGILGHINKDNYKYEVSYIIDYLKNNYPNKTEELFSELIRRIKLKE